MRSSQINAGPDLYSCSMGDVCGSCPHAATCPFSGSMSNDVHRSVEEFKTSDSQSYLPACDIIDPGKSDNVDYVEGGK